MEENNVHQLYQPAYPRPTYARPLHRILPDDARERQETVLVEENATVRSIVAMVGVYPEDAGNHLIRDLTAAEVRYIVRAAYRHGRSSRG